MSSRKISHVLRCMRIAPLMLLLSGCPIHNDSVRGSVASVQFETGEIAFSIRLQQDEREGLIRILVDAYSPFNGIENDSVEISGSDVLLVSVQGQDVKPEINISYDESEFVFQQSALNLPAKFVVKLIRDGVKEDALESFVTLNAVFETISPREGDVFALDSVVEFAWALRDGDGNAVGGDEYGQRIVGMSAYPKPQELFNSPYTDVAFDQIKTAIDGQSRFAQVPALQLVPDELLGEYGEQLDLFVYLSDDGYLGLPVSLEFDSALAKDRNMQPVSGGFGYARQKSVNISVR